MCAADCSVAPSTDASRTVATRDRPLSILVADDDYGHRRMLELVLSAHAYDVFGAQDGREALDHLNGATPDLMILDVDMPHASGFDVCDHAKGDDRLRNVPVVIMTGKAPEQVEARAERSRPDALVYKPIGAADLRSLIDGLTR